MTGDRNRRGSVWAGYLLGLSLLLFASGAPAQERQPLEPMDTSSPRATLESFLDTMNEAVSVFRKEGDRERARALVMDATRCLDLSEVAPTVVNTVAFETALRLKEILDRIKVPVARRIPDAPALADDELTSWTIPNTEISIARVEEGPLEGHFLFTPQTVARSEEFYGRVEHLPYKSGSGKGAHYEQYQLGSGEYLSESVERLPEWAKGRIHGQAAWQWIALALCLALGSAAMGLLYVGGTRLVSSWPRVSVYVLPATLMVMALLFQWIAREIHLTGGVATTVTLVFTGIFFVGGVRLVAVLLGQVADAVISTARLRPKGVDSQLVRLGFRVLIIAVTAALIVEAANRLGWPAYSVLTGLGIGGLAVALAARDTLANFLGSVMIMFDRPFRVGDWIKVGESEGTVEDIGFRSTRIRTFYNSVVSIPSTEMVTASIDNMGMREYRRVRTVLQITYDTPSEKIEAFVEGIKDIIRTHPTTRKDSFHVVFNDFGAHSLDILVYFFLKVSDWSAELVERQKVLLEIVRLAERLEVSFAFPTQTLHVESIPEERPHLPAQKPDTGA